MSFFVNAVTDEWGTTYVPTTAGFTLLVVIMLAILLLGTALFGGKKKFSTKQLSFSAMAVALAMVTSMIKLFKLPYGGSVTLLSMLFIVLIGYWYGLGTGLATGIAYGLLQLIIDPYILSVPQMLVDYIFAFGALGLAGLLAKKNFKFDLQISYIVGVLGRYFFAFLSGWIFFGSYAGDYGFKSGVTYSLVYNGAYLAAEAVLTLIIISLPPVASALKRIKEIAIS